MINCRRPSNRSSKHALPFGPSNSYFFSTATHGIRRRSAASASRARVNSFSFTRSFCRAASHSFGDTTFGLFISDVSVCVPIFAFRSLIVQRTNTAVLDAYFCLPDARREITYICDKRLLRGVAAPKSVSRCRGLHCRGGILDSNRLRRVSSLGVAELEPEAGNCAVVNRLSDYAHPSLGLRRYAARNSGDGQSSRSASAPQSYPACRCQRDNFY